MFNKAFISVVAISVVAISVVALSGALYLGSSFAQGLSDKEKHFAELYPGAVAQAGGDMHLRGSALTDVALWYSKGPAIGVLTKGAKVRIQDIKEYPSLIGTQTWVEVEVLTSGEPELHGWVYYGGPDYLKILPQE